MHHPLHATKHAVPLGVKHACTVFPTEQVSPLGENNAEVVGVSMLASGPGHPFGGDAVAMTAAHAAHPIVETHGNVPERNVIEGAGILCGVVGGTLFAAAGAHGA